ncbi:MAG: GNAT family N-acetyltransferase [Rickettsiales bacterium]|nr:GNAT family N-acetyltransferase [Rickettsiales bacterium]
MLVDGQLVVDEKIYLKQLAEEETETFFNLTIKNIGILIQWFEWATDLSLEKSKKFIQNSCYKNKRKKGCDLGIYYEEKLVGVIALMTYNDVATKGAELAYWISKDMGGKGIMTKCVKKIEEYCFTKLNLDKLFILALAENIPSRKIPENLDYTLVDADIEMTEINYRKSVYLYYVKTQTEYKSNFWNYLDVLVKESTLIIDGKKGEYNKSLNIVNPVDFGFFNNDWDDYDQIDVFVGSAGKKYIDHVICAIDFKNKLCDIKVLYGCTIEEKNLVFSTLSKVEGVLIVPNPNEDVVEEFFE